MFEILNCFVLVLRAPWIDFDDFWWKMTALLRSFRNWKNEKTKTKRQTCVLKNRQNYWSHYWLECGISNFASSLHLVRWIIGYQHLPISIWKIHGVNLLWLNFGDDPTSMEVAVPIENFDLQTDLLTVASGKCGKWARQWDLAVFLQKQECLK